MKYIILARQTASTVLSNPAAVDRRTIVHSAYRGAIAIVNLSGCDLDSDITAEDAFIEHLAMNNLSFDVLNAPPNLRQLLTSEERVAAITTSPAQGTGTQIR